MPRSRAQTGQDLTYETIEAPLDGFRRGGRPLSRRRRPWRQRHACRSSSKRSRSPPSGRSARAVAGAVNSLKFEGDRILAENFDGVGLVNDIQRNLGRSIRGKRVLLLGAGGAVRGALLPFLEQKPALLVVANRTVAKAQGAGRPSSRRSASSKPAATPISASAAFDIVVNATSTSMRGEVPPVTRAAFAPGCLAYDLVYGKGLTPFLRLARDAGARTGWRTASACWSSRRPRHSSGGAACGRRRAP